MSSEESSGAVLNLRVPLGNGCENLTIDVFVGDTCSELKPCLLFCHGLASNRSVWNDVASTLARSGYSSATVDLRGHGDSSISEIDLVTTRADHPYNLAQNVEDLHEVLNFLELNRDLESDVGVNKSQWSEKIIIVGHSYGGNIALEFGIKFSSRICGIICIDGGFIELSKVYSDFSLCVSALSPPSFRHMTASSLEIVVREDWCRDWPESGIQSMLKNFRSFPPHRVEPALPPLVHMCLLKDLYNHRPSLRYDRVQCPVLVLPTGGGGRTPFTGDKRRDVAEMDDKIPTEVMIRWFTEAGHDLPAQRPVETAQAIQEAVESGFMGLGT